MALINCPECNSPVSDTCEQCIHCGYALAKTNSPPKREKTKQLIAQCKRSISKPVLLSIAFLGVVAALIVLLVTGSNNKDIYKKLYYSVPRESVLAEFGEADRTSYSEGKVWAEFYDNVEFLGETGTLHVLYRGRDYVTDANFEVTWPKSKPSSKQDSKKYADAVAKFYTKKYGEIKDGNSGFYTSSDYWAPTNVDKITLYDTFTSSGDFIVSIQLN